jgi:FkbM family methyltransferase
MLFKEYLKKQIYKGSFPWILLRWYVRYFPWFTVKGSINTRVNSYFESRPYRFVTSTKAGFSLEGETSDLLQRFVYLYGVWEPELTAWLGKQLRPGDVFVDVGANIGFFSLLGARLVGDEGRVIGIEASPTIFGKLTANIVRNQASNVRLVNQAAVDHSHTVHVFKAPGRNLGGTSIFSDDKFEFESTVDGQRLCDILSREEICKARVIKIDVEGAEVLALRGLLPVLVHARKELEIVIEVGGDLGRRQMRVI